MKFPTENLTSELWPSPLRGDSCSAVGYIGYSSGNYYYYYLQNSSKPLNPMMYLDRLSFMHFIPGGHWYPESGSGEQKVSGIAREFIVMSLLKHKIYVMEDSSQHTMNSLDITSFLACPLTQNSSDLQSTFDL